MTLSIIKLEQLLKTNGFLVKKYFTVNNCVIYIEVFNINNAETFMLYIPSKYEINIDNKNCYKIKYIDIDGENIFKNLEERVNNSDIEKNYEELSINISPEKDNGDLEKILINNYDHEVLLKDLNKNDIENLKNIFYQMSRLKLCVKNIKYKLTILYKNYLCIINKNNDIDCFIIKDYKGHDEKYIYITTDLENLFKKISIISEDIKLVRNDFYKILNENQLKNTKILSNILEQKNSVIKYSDIIYKKKQELDAYILNLEKLLEKTNDSEGKIISKIISLNDISDLNSLSNDIQRSHDIHRYEKELENINSVKEEIVKELLMLRNKKENITLEVDKILFDNNVMISIINKNFEKLIELK